MASTPISGSSAYAAISDLKAYRDWRQLADWVATNEVRGSEDAFNVNPYASKHLASASGLVEAACLKGGRYTTADLAILNGNSKALLTKLVCWLAIESMSQFKKRTAEDQKQIEWSQDMLAALAVGERIFALQEVADAGLAEAVDMYPAGSVYEAHRPSVQADRMFGDRRQCR